VRVATKTNSRTGIARYQQVYTVLAQALAEGTIGAGQALPSEPALVRRYGVSRTTVRRALERLAAEGSIIRRRGSGTFARSGLQRVDSARKMTRILDDIRGLGTNTRSRLLQFAKVRTPEFLLRESPDFGENALLIRRLRSVDGEAIALMTIYVPERLATLVTPRRIRAEAVRVTLDKLGHRAATAEQVTTAVAADPVASRYLRCPVGAALLNVRKLVRDTKGQILDYSSFVYRPDCYELNTDIARFPSPVTRNRTATMRPNQIAARGNYRGRSR
jgi:GntR family transcriptional regulator